MYCNKRESARLCCSMKFGLPVGNSRREDEKEWREGFSGWFVDDSCLCLLYASVYRQTCLKSYCTLYVIGIDKLIDQALIFRVEFSTFLNREAVARRAEWSVAGDMVLECLWGDEVLRGCSSA